MLLETKEDLLLDQLRDLYSVETQIEVAIPILVDQATAPALRDFLAACFEETEGQIVRIQQICGMLGVSARGPRCLGVAGLLQEMEDTMRRSARGPMLDAVIIACLRRVTHYEMAVYGSAAWYATELEQVPIAELLCSSLEEEQAADKRLARIVEEELTEQPIQEGVLAA